MSTEPSVSPADLQTVARKAAESGFAIVRPMFEQGVTAIAKEGQASYDLITEADIACEKAVTDTILAAFPEHAILGEEGQTSGPGRRSVDDDLVAEPYLWIVDPIDGTNNFAHGIPHFAISVACYAHGEPVCGVVVNPARDEWYEATVGGGATKNGQSIHVSPAASMAECLIGCGFYYDRGAMMRATLGAIEEAFSHNIHGIRRMGTASLDLCQVACGMYGGFFEYQLSPWDFAAARLILTEAGGQITTGHGEPLPLSVSSVLASNTVLHATLQNITAKHHP